MPDIDDTSDNRKADDVVDVAAQLARRARDAAYVAVGLGVLGLQRAQVARRALLREDRVEEGVARARHGVATGAQRLGALVDRSTALVSSQLEPLGAQLPEPARGIVTKACAELEVLGEQLRQLVTLGA
jgi:hypothetical protein